MNSVFNRNIKAILYTLFFFLGFQLVAQVDTSKTPRWVSLQSYTTTLGILEEDITYGYVILLADEQVYVPKEARYTRMVKKITDNVGIQDVANITADYDPKYQSLTFHTINVVRNGKTINKLDANNFQTMRRESNAENYIYDGRLSAMINLADIRKGDILDYSYTISGFNPIHKGNFSGAFSLNNYAYINKSHIKISANKTLQYKLFNSKIQPTITKQFGLTHYQWTAEQVNPPLFENNTPSWLFEYHSLFVSDYKDWSSVVNWALEVYKYNPKLSPELNKKINSIKAQYKLEAERIKATLEFVQNDIRYLGFEDGIGSYKPFSPNVVFKQRFGDCKDKTLLMIAMLKAMDIKAYPLLINTSLSQNLPEVLPTPKIFDHVVVKVIDKNGLDLYYDPTITNQKGAYDEIFFPDYGYGLLVKDGETALETLKTHSSNLIEVYDTFTLEKVGKGATLNVKTMYYDYEADKMRNYHKSSSLSSIKDDFKNYYANYYKTIEVIEPPKFEDDSINNILTINESYKLSDIWETLPGDDSNISVTFSPTAIYDILMIPSEKERTKPFALYYPAAKRHHIKVKLPRSWDADPVDVTIDSKNFKYEFKGKYDKYTKTLSLFYHYKNLNNYVKPKDFETYYKDIKRLETQTGYYIYIPKYMAASDSKISEANDTNSSSNSNEWVENTITSLFYYVIIPIAIVVIGLIIYVIRQNRK